MVAAMSRTTRPARENELNGFVDFFRSSYDASGYGFIGVVGHGAFLLLHLQHVKSGSRECSRARWKVLRRDRRRCHHGGQKMSGRSSMSSGTANRGSPFPFGLLTPAIWHVVKKPGQHLARWRCDRGYVAPRTASRFCPSAFYMALATPPTKVVGREG